MHLYAIIIRDLCNLQVKESQLQKGMDFLVEIIMDNLWLMAIYFNPYFKFLCTNFIWLWWYLFIFQSPGQVIPVAQGNVLSQTTNVFDAPSRKRSAVQTPQAAPYVPRRKTRPQPSIRPSIPFPVPMPRPLISPSIPLRARLPRPSTNPFVPSSAAPHVKWQGIS